MVRKNLKVVTYVFLLGVFIGSAAVAFAAEARSTWKNFPYPVLGHYYRSQAMVSNTNGAYGYTWFESRNEQVPEGYMGVAAGLYRNNALLERTDYSYNNNTAYSWSIATNIYSYSGTYHSRGTVQVYNGDGYDGDTTNQTPSLNIN